jgi:hypothetical protein
MGNSNAHGDDADLHGRRHRADLEHERNEMSREELKEWTETFRPDLLPVLRDPDIDRAFARLNAESGLSLTADDLYRRGVPEVCGLYLAALKLTVAPHPEPEPEPKPEIGPRKPPPALPVEAWHTKAFDADAAHAATLAMCRGNR